MARKSIYRACGLGHALQIKDLNARACVALAGLSDTPANDIAALLRSDQPIDPGTRKMLADANDGSPDGITFKIGSSDRTGFAKKYLRNFTRVRQGRFARSLIPAMGYEGAIEQLADKMRKDASSAKACVTLANKVDAWIDRVRKDMPEHSDLDDFALELAFLYAQTRKAEPESELKPSLPLFAELMRAFLQLQDRSLRSDEWFVG